MTEDVIQTGCINFNVTDVNNKPIKNVLIGINEGANTYTGRTDKDGEITLNDVVYGTYDIALTRTGYLNIIQEDFVVDDPETTVSFTMSHLDPNPDLLEVDLDELYTFQLTGRTIPDYRCNVSIIQWLKGNLEGLTDDNDNTVFSKVNYGYNEDTLKGFGKKPVADVYINNITYSSDLYTNVPDKVNSIIICYLKGNMNKTYEKACELTDFLIQEFEENKAFRELTAFVRNTFVSNVRIQVIPTGKNYGVLCAFELEHDLY